MDALAGAWGTLSGSANSARSLFWIEMMKSIKFSIFAFENASWALEGMVAKLMNGAVDVTAIRMHKNWSHKFQDGQALSSGTRARMEWRGHKQEARGNCRKSTGFAVQNTKLCRAVISMSA